MTVKTPTRVPGESATKRRDYIAGALEIRVSGSDTLDVRKLSSIWLWGAAAVAALPLLPAISTSRIFYIRDLSLNFWPRYVWLRRTILSGVWPLWDPYMGGGQSAVTDGLHQMFFPPAMLLRLVGPETLGFNLWVGLPLPIAALGAWLFFARLGRRQRQRSAR